MAKNETDIRHDSKSRMKRYRAQMIEKGYISTTIFLSKEHRAELKHLGVEHRLTRAEAAEHIFKAYLQSDLRDKYITQTNDTNAGSQTETRAIIEAFEVRLKALEDRDLKQVERTENPTLVVEPICLQTESDDNSVTQTDNINAGSQIEPPGVMADQSTGNSIPAILDGIDPKNITIEERDRLVLKLHEQFPGKTQAKDRIKVLNDKKVLFNGEPWTTKQFSDQLTCARRRAKK